MGVPLCNQEQGPAQERGRAGGSSHLLTVGRHEVEAAGRDGERDGHAGKLQVALAEDGVERAAAGLPKGERAQQLAVGEAGAWAACLGQSLHRATSATLVLLRGAALYFGGAWRTRPRGAAHFVLPTTLRGRPRRERTPPLGQPGHSTAEQTVDHDTHTDTLTQFWLDTLTTTPCCLGWRGERVSLAETRKKNARKEPRRGRADATKAGQGEEEEKRAGGGHRRKGGERGPLYPCPHTFSLCPLGDY